MKQRVISAIVATIIALPLIIMGSYAYYVGVSLLSIIGFYEIIKVREQEKKIDFSVKAITLVAYICIVFSAFNISNSFSLDYRLLILDLFACFLPLIVFRAKDYDAEDALVLFAVSIFLGTGFNYLIVIRNMSIYYLLYVMIATFMSDTFAHFYGTKIGRHKLCPQISPNKTVEGMIGGVVFGTFISSMFFLTFINTNAPILLVAVISCTLSIIAEFGDLVFSSIKRKYGVKDYGNIMPGHGGVLDRLDSLFFALLAFSFLVSFF